MHRYHGSTRLARRSPKGEGGFHTAVIIAAALAVGLGALGVSTSESRTQLVLNNEGDLTAEGAFTCDLTLPASIVATAPEPVAATLERDRMIMSRQPGMLRKHIPLTIDFTTGNLLSGGRYLFDTEENAAAYKTFVENWTLFGEKFLERPYFLESDCHSWSVVGARDFADLHTSHVVLRTERWQVPADNQRIPLKARWPQLRAEASARGITSVWLLYNKQEQLVTLVYFVNRLAPKNPATPDFVTLFALQESPALGNALNDLGYTKVFDRTQWSWTIWLPFLAGDRGEASIWPHSPPLPEPAVGDGVCQPSRGENNVTAPSDCGATCGDGICQAGESARMCPSDCVN